MTLSPGNLIFLSQTYKNYDFKIIIIDNFEFKNKKEVNWILKSYCFFSMWIITCIGFGDFFIFEK